MRLTLRTLLAYLDDILEPAQAQEIGRKIEGSPVAQQIVKRIREVVRRRRLKAPTLSGPESGVDPNIVAEYLDNRLTPPQVAQTERILLNSEMHLAEAAAVHQILTLVLGEPREVLPQNRQRMYALGPVPPTDRLVTEAAGEDAESAAAPVGSNGAGNGAAKDVSEVAAAVVEPHRRSSMWPLVTAGVLIGLWIGLQVTDPAKTSTEDTSVAVAGTGADAAVGTSTETVADNDPDADGAGDPDSRVAALAESGTPSDTTETETTDTDTQEPGTTEPSTTGIVAVTEPPTDPDTLTTTDPPPADPGSAKVAAAEAAAVDTGDAKSSADVTLVDAPPPADVPDDPVPDPEAVVAAAPAATSPQTPAEGSESDPGKPADSVSVPEGGTDPPAEPAVVDVAPPDPGTSDPKPADPKPADPAVAMPADPSPTAPTTTTEPADGSTDPADPTKPVENAGVVAADTDGTGDKGVDPPAPAPGRKLVLQITSEDSVLLRRGSSGWRMAKSGEPIGAGDRIAVPRPYVVELKPQGVPITMHAGAGSRMSAFASADADLGIRLERGHLVFSRAADDGEDRALTLSLVVADRTWTISLPVGESRVAVDCTPVPPIRLDTAVDGFPAKVWAVGSAGSVEVREGDAEPRQLGSEDRVALAGPAPGDVLVEPGAMSDWLLAKDPVAAWLAGPVAPTDRRDAIRFAREFDETDTISDTMPPLVKHDRAWMSRRAVQCLSLTDDYQALVRALAIAPHEEAVSEAVLGLRTWLPGESENGDRLRKALEQEFTMEDAEVIYRLLWGFDEAHGRDLKTSRELVRWLSHDRLVVRRLAYFHVLRLTGNQDEYRPALSRERFTSFRKRWERQIDKYGKLLSE